MKRIFILGILTMLLVSCSAEAKVEPIVEAEPELEPIVVEEPGIKLKDFQAIQSFIETVPVAQIFLVKWLKNLWIIT